MNDTATQEITITTLGASGTGKTCFLVGMYAAMRTGVRGFTFSAEDLDQDLWLSDWWDRIVGERGKDRWPPPNDNNPVEYRFDLCYGLRSWKRFNWLDYRGGALRDRKEVSDVGRLRQFFARSDAVFLCVPADGLASGRRHSSIGRMTQYLSELYASGKQPEVVITITKSDLLISKMKPKEVIQRVKEWFGPLFVTGGHWTVMICPVTLGTALAKNLDSGAIQPRNVHLPVSFAVYMQLARELEIVDQYAQQAEAQVQKHDSRIGRWFRGPAEETADQARDLEELRKDLSQKLELLMDELFGEADIYYDGKRLRFDD